MKKKKIVVLFLCIVLLFVVGHYKGILAKSEGKIQSYFTPFGVVLGNFSIKIKAYTDAVVNIRDLQSENDDLKKTTNELQAKVTELETAKKDNENLRKLLNFTEVVKVNWIAAEITAYDPSNVRQSVILNKGEADGIKKGDSVVSEGFLIGRIIELHQKSAKVLLVIDASSGIPVAVQGTMASGLLRGKIGFGLTLDNVPQGEAIAKNDIIITSGLGGDFPRGLIIGKIEEVDSKDNGIFQQARVRPAADFKNLKHVLILS